MANLAASLTGPLGKCHLLGLLDMGGCDSGDSMLAECLVNLIESGSPKMIDDANLRVAVNNTRGRCHRTRNVHMAAQLGPPMRNDSANTCRMEDILLRGTPCSRISMMSFARSILARK